MLQRIPEKYFEMAGTVFGLIACFSIAAQVYKEFFTSTPSTISLVYSTGFLIIFLFWALYGIRFKRPALWLTNGLAVLIQSLLLVIIMQK